MSAATLAAGFPFQKLPLQQSGNVSAGKNDLSCHFWLHLLFSAFFFFYLGGDKWIRMVEDVDLAWFVTVCALFFPPGPTRAATHMDAFCGPWSGFCYLEFVHMQNRAELCLECEVWPRGTKIVFKLGLGFWVLTTLSFEREMLFSQRAMKPLPIQLALLSLLGCTEHAREKVSHRMLTSLLIIFKLLE